MHYTAEVAQIDAVAGNHAERNGQRQNADAVRLKPGDLGQLDGQKRKRADQRQARHDAAPLVILD